jgi:hypothetical protein
LSFSISNPFGFDFHTTLLILLHGESSVDISARFTPLWTRSKTKRNEANRTDSEFLIVLPNHEPVHFHAFRFVNGRLLRGFSNRWTGVQSASRCVWWSCIYTARRRSDCCGITVTAKEASSSSPGNYLNGHAVLCPRHSIQRIFPIFSHIPHHSTDSWDYRFFLFQFLQILFIGFNRIRFIITENWMLCIFQFFSHVNRRSADGWDYRSFGIFQLRRAFNFDWARKRTFRYWWLLLAEFWSFDSNWIF